MPCQSKIANLENLLRFYINEPTFLVELAIFLRLILAVRDLGEKEGADLVRLVVR